MNVVLLGPPGAGKGTQAERVAKSCGFPHISTGDMLRDAVAKGTELGKLAKGYMEKGELVPDEVIIGIVKERLLEPDAEKGFILDGFPRTLEQAIALENELSALGRKIDFAVNIEVSDEEVVRRISGRRICRSCGRPYHVEFNPPKADGICDVCGGELYRRADDEPEAVRRRLEVYHAQTAPLVDFYGQRGLLVGVDGARPVEEVSSEIENLLNCRKE